MRDRDPIIGWKVILAVVVLLLVTERAPAYVGPGAGLEFIGYFASMLAVGVAAFSTVLLYPIYSFLRWLRGDRTSRIVDDPSGSAIQKIG